MMRTVRLTAALVAAVALLAVSSAPASANDIAEPVWPDCVRNPDVPTCVNFAFDVAVGAIETAYGVYERNAKPYVCDVQWILEGERCPE